ncbi:MAG TPA: CDP-alcohol phosphatidyltransferase family protein [Solirubrobacteraceae bacterium]|nr:CDP-alcohol phosphatidyltransferase family protein [Solirubrobacteraceae bacterium]
MLDAPMRRLVAPAVESAARRLDGLGVSATAVTAAGFAVGIGACVAAALAAWPLALALWLANRALDGVDGPLARLRGTSDRGGFLDIAADFTVYGAFVLAVAIAEPDARLACVALLVAYYVSGTAFLAWSSLAERRALRDGDPRSLRFVGGLAEGTETIIAYALFCLLPGSAETIAWAFAVVVAITALQRVVFAVRALGEPHVSEGAPTRAGS